MRLISHDKTKWNKKLGKGPRFHLEVVYNGWRPGASCVFTRRSLHGACGVTESRSFFLRRCCIAVTSDSAEAAGDQPPQERERGREGEREKGREGERGRQLPYVLMMNFSGI